MSSGVFLNQAILISGNATPSRVNKDQIRPNLGLSGAYSGLVLRRRCMPRDSIGLYEIGKSV